MEKLFVYSGNDPIKGSVIISPQNSKKIDHKGIKIELIGQIGKKFATIFLSQSINKELFYDRGNHFEFTSLLVELAPSGDLTESKTYNFEFTTLDKQFESYNGVNVKLR